MSGALGHSASTVSRRADINNLGPTLSVIVPLVLNEYVDKPLPLEGHSAYLEGGVSLEANSEPPERSGHAVTLISGARRRKAAVPASLRFGPPNSYPAWGRNTFLAVAVGPEWPLGSTLDSHTRGPFGGDSVPEGSGRESPPVQPLF